MLAADAAQVLAIYQAGLDTGQASFETTAPGWDAFDAARLTLHRYVAADAGTRQVLGRVAASPVSGRCVYAGVIGHSVYVDPGHYRRGIGAALLRALSGAKTAARAGTRPRPSWTRIAALRSRQGRRADIALLRRRRCR